MRRAALVTLILAAAVATAACGSTSNSNALPTPTLSAIPSHLPAATPTATSEPSGVSWSISPIDAQFSQACFCTDYSVTVFVTNFVVTTDWAVEWNLDFELVDPRGTADPDVAGSGAAIDKGCDNNGVGTSKPATSTLTFTGNNQHENTSFTWYHPDPASAPPGYAAGVFHCDHNLQGPHGHQGLVSVKVSHGVLHCIVGYYGTKSGMSTDANQSGAPVCSRS